MGKTKFPNHKKFSENRICPICFSKDWVSIRQEQTEEVGFITVFVCKMCGFMPFISDEEDIFNK